MFRTLVFSFVFILAQAACADGPPANSEGANVVDFGADPTGQFDSTAAIQAAINSTFTSIPTFGPHQTAGRVYFPAGAYRVSTINATGLNGLHLEGSPGTVVLYADQQTVSMPVIDMAGTINSLVEGIIVSGQQVLNSNPPAVIPSVGILLADTVDGGRCTKNTIRNSGSLGWFYHAALYIKSCTDSLVEDTNFQVDNPNVHALFIGGVDPFNTPSHVTLAPQWTWQPAGNHVFNHVELHGKFLGGGGISHTIRLWDTSAIRFFGGLVDATGSDGDVLINGTVSGLVFNGTQFYSEGGIPADVIIDNAGTLFSPAFYSCSIIGNNAPPILFGGNYAPISPVTIGNY